MNSIGMDSVLSMARERLNNPEQAETFVLQRISNEGQPWGTRWTNKTLEAAMTSHARSESEGRKVRTLKITVTCEVVDT